MAKKLDQIIVIDVEATCWQGQPPENQQSEIIEIGICPVDIASGQRLEKESILVKPAISKLSPFCTQLTTLTPEQVDAGISFAEACQYLKKKYLTQQRTWASYGDYDRNQFQRQCQLFSVSYPFSPRHLNIKNLLALIYALPQEIGMDEALKLLNLSLEGTHHRGGDDAGNIAQILSSLLKKARNN
jgi:inhibitor of KinA sporulation pathway (predicted exonuclease)